jgi:hypothetical protein
MADSTRPVGLGSARYESRLHAPGAQEKVGPIVTMKCANTAGANVDERALAGGGRSALHRRGDVVLRASGPWSSTVHSFLRHLEAGGFQGAPRVAGSGFDERGREMLTYIEGEFVHPAPWPEAALPIFGSLLRQLHNAGDSFRRAPAPRGGPGMVETLEIITESTAIAILVHGISSPRTGYRSLSSTGKQRARSTPWSNSVKLVGSTHSSTTMMSVGESDSLRRTSALGTLH